MIREQSVTVSALVLTMKKEYVIYNIIRRGKLLEKFTVDFYKKEDGTKPVGVFIRSLSIKMKAKIVANMHLLEEYGNMAREPLSKELEDGIFELRIIEGKDIVRVLYFFDKDRIIIATNGFVKKQQKTYRSEIDLAKDRRADYYRRKEAGTYE